MKYQTILMVGALSFFTQCNFEIDGEIGHIYRMSSPNNKFEIYESLIEPTMAFGSGNIETTILKTGEVYNPRLPGNFNGYNILGWIGNDTLKVIQFHKKQEVEEKIPKSKFHEVKKYKDFYIDIDHRTSFGGERCWFSFDSLYFHADSIYFIQYDSVGVIKNKLGLLKGQIRLSLEKDTVSIIQAEYFERIEDHFDKIKEGNELGYPYTVGVYCEITPKNRLESSLFINQPVTIELKVENEK
jgi:hypothetical protein